MNIHPKTAGAALGSAIGVVIVGVLQSIHSIHLDPTLNGSIPAAFALIGSWLSPGATATAVTAAAPVDQPTAVIPPVQQ